MNEDPSELKKHIMELEEQNAALKEENAALREEVRTWKRKLLASNKRIELIHDLNLEAIENPPPPLN